MPPLGKERWTRGGPNGLSFFHRSDATEWVFFCAECSLAMANDRAVLRDLLNPDDARETGWLYRRRLARGSGALGLSLQINSAGCAGVRGLDTGVPPW